MKVNNLEYLVVNIYSAKDYKQAQRLRAQGWRLVSLGVYSMRFERLIKGA